MQTKLQSFIESCVQYAIGYCVAMLAQIIIYPLYGMELSMGQQAELALWFTGISICRSYYVRRFFNWFHHSRSLVNGCSRH